MRLMQVKRLWLILFFLTIAGGCTQPVKKHMSRLQQSGLASIQSWEAQGRGSYRSGKDGGGFSFDLNVSSQRTHLKVWSNLAGKSIDVVILDDVVQVEQGDQLRLYRSVEAFSELELGWDVGFDQVLYYVRGLIPEDAGLDVSYNGSILEASNKEIEYKAERFKSFCGQDVPTKIKLIHKETSRLVLVVKKWHLGCEV